jgi:hypothetical protein
MLQKKLRDIIDALNPYRYYSLDTSYQIIHYNHVFLMLNMADISAHPSE